MSGIEAAGLVLGSIPLVISALKYYDHGIMAIERARSYNRYRTTLIDALNEEQTRLENICEFILDGLVPKSRIERMISDPCGGLWKDEFLKLRLKARLWNSATQFEQTTKEMKAAMQELMDKLDVGSDGKFRNSNSSFISLQIRRVVLALSKPMHDRMLSKIAECTTKLYFIADMNIRLESKRGQRSQAKVLAVLRDLCISLHWALTKSLVCDCRHQIRLKLRTVPSEVLHAETEIQRLQYLAIFLRVSYPIKVLRDLENIAVSCDWVDLRVEGLVNTEKRLVTQQEDNCFTGQDCARPFKKIKQERLDFQQPGSSGNISSCSPGNPMTSTTTTVSVNNIVVPQTLSEVSPGLQTITNLCDKMKKSQKQKQQTCYGYLIDDKRSRRFGLYPLTSDGATTSTTISLREVLDRTSSIPLFTLKDRHSLAVVLASNVAQLCNTAWLPLSLLADRIMFAPKQNGGLYDDIFIEKPSHPHLSGPYFPNSTSSTRNLTVISLAFLLTELILDISIFTAEEVFHNLERAYYTVNKLLAKVRGESEQYYLAISRCLFESKLHEDMQNGDQFRETMYSGVVAPLEQELRALEIGF